MLGQLAGMLSRLYATPLVMVTRSPLLRLRRYFGTDELARLLGAGITIVAPASYDDLDDIRSTLRRGAPVRHPEGGWLLAPGPVNPPMSPAGPPLPKNGPSAPRRWVRDAGPLYRIPTSRQRSAAPTVELSQRRQSPPELPSRAARTPPPQYSPPPAIAAPPDPARRRLNIRVTDPRGKPMHRGLACDQSYLIKVAIGALDAENVLVDPHPFPTGQLPETRQGWELDVVATVDGADIGEYAKELFLPTTGDSWCCDCPPRSIRHLCEERRQWLDVPLHTRPWAGDAAIVVRIYYGVTLLQVAEVAVRVGGDDTAAAFGEITYCRDPSLNDLSRHDGRTMSCHLADNTADRHSLVVNNGYGHPIYFEYVDAQTDRTASALRKALYATHLGPDLVVQHRIGPGGRPVKDFARYVTDLRRLADIGNVAYRALMVDSDGEYRLRKWLSDAARASGRPPVIQLARSGNTRLSLPWQLLYDLPLTDGADRAGECHSVRRWGPGSTETSVPARCPYEDEHDLVGGTICLFGFWGLAHIIEAPPSTPTRLLPRQTSAVEPPKLVAAVNNTLSAYDEHLWRLRDRLHDDFAVAWTWRELRAEAAGGSDVLYFYCHGRFAAHGGLEIKQPVLDLGGGNDEEWITPARLGSWSATTRWAQRRPLVILNGCSTGEDLPDVLAGFVDTFVNSLHGAGVLATEIAVESRAAQYVAEVLLDQLWSGLQTGEAVRAMRWQLLAEGSVFGLAYTPYCDAFLGLPTRARPNASRSPSLVGPSH